VEDIFVPDPCSTPETVPLTNLYPIRFKPLLQRYLWGGRRLGELLRKPVGAEPVCAESWELCDRGADQSIIAHGPLKGTSLHALVTERAAELLGMHAGLQRFPLLFKFLDAASPLSVQVHPNDAAAALLSPPDLGKTEAWVVLAAAPGAVIYAGLARGFDSAAAAREARRGTLELCLHQVEARAGDCLFLPAGAVHALGAGFLIAELQQSSDATFRLWDWNRLGPDGQPRPLHLEQGLAAIDDRLGPLECIAPRPLADPGRERLVECDKFVWDRWTLTNATSLGGDGRAHFLAVVEGSAVVAGDACPEPLRPGDTILLPAVCGPTAVVPAPHAILLDAYLP
jgi:mannose-6-phosphate isomerase